MTRAYLAFTDTGLALAKRLADALPGSVARCGQVVITGTAPHTAAMARARSFAPPRCPDKMGTANRPHSSTTTTAGSVVLLLQ